MGSLISGILRFPIAAVVVIALFLLMYGLIRTDIVPEIERVDRPRIVLGPEIKETPIDRTRPQRPDVTQVPDPPSVHKSTLYTPDPGQTGPVVTERPRRGAGELTLSPPDRDVQPIVRIQPAEGEFQRCIKSGPARTERVALEFDVTPAGQVVNVRVIGSTDSCYERSAIRAAQKWKYSPKMVGGKSVGRSGVRTVILYQVGGQ